MNQKNTIKEILEALASQNGHEDKPLVFNLEPHLIQDAMNALPDYRKVFAPVIPALTDTGKVYEAYERMREAGDTRHAILLLVACQTAQQFRDALETLPIRHSSEWRFLNQAT